MKFTYDAKTGAFTISGVLDAAGALSASGKSNVHLSTRGNQPTGVLVNGKPLIIGINAYTKV